MSKLCGKFEIRFRARHIDPAHKFNSNHLILKSPDTREGESNAILPDSASALLCLCVILSVAKNPGSFSAQTTAPSTTDRPPQRPVTPKSSMSTNPRFFASFY